MYTKYRSQFAALVAVAPLEFPGSFRSAGQGSDGGPDGCRTSGALASARRAPVRRAGGV